MKGIRTIYVLAVSALASTAALAGPPFQTDDPQPIDYRNYEFYTFGASDGTSLETDAVTPGFEFNWGALPNVHLHIIVPATGIYPAGEPREFGMGDIELGIKLRFVQEGKHRPMIGTFTMFEIPTGNADKGLGIGKTWYKLPIWVQKSFGPWTTYGGGGETLVNVPGFRNYPFAGWLVQRDLGKKVTLGTEVYYHGPEGDGTPFSKPATMVDAGGYYKFRDPGFQLLFCYGHTATGKSENYAYMGLYWTWGKKADADKSGDQVGAAFSHMPRPGLMGGM